MPGKIEVEAGENIAYALVRFRQEAIRFGIQRIGPRVPRALKSRRKDFYQKPSQRRRLRKYLYDMRRRKAEVYRP